MALFRYKAVDTSGELLKGEMDAQDQTAVLDRLRNQGLLPVSIDEAGSGLGLGGIRWPGFGRRRGLSRSELITVTRQLANLLAAGLPLDRALSIIVNLAEEGGAREVLKRIQERVRGGSSLADAMETQEGTFSRFYLNMVRAGEAGGSVEAALARLAEFLERSKALRESVTSALIYPIILLSVAGLSVIILLTFVVPRFQQLFEDAGEALPLATQIVIAVGEALRGYWWAGLAMVLLLLLFLRRQLSQPERRYRWDGWVLRMPLVGDMVAKVEMARFSRTLGTLLENGVPMLAALSIVRETLSNRVMANAVNEVAENLKAGQGLADPLMETGAFPRLAVHMIRVGEETGRLEKMLLQVANTYDGEVQAAVKRLLTLLEPVLILGLGVLIAGIIMSILVAILGLNVLVF